MEILIATGSRHKRMEFAAMFPEFDIAIPEDKNISFAPKETGSSFFENALIKAETLFRETGRPSLADDSGLCVDALAGAPGIFSARFGSENGKKLSDSERSALLLAKMAGNAERNCRFVCCLVLYIGKDRFFSAQETLEGILLDAPRGNGGFGYDPIVFLPDLGRSVAELSAEEKNRISHRGKAAKAIKAMLIKEAGAALRESL